MKPRLASEATWPGCSSRRAPSLTLASAIALERTDEVERLLREDPDALKPGHRWGTLIVRAAAEAPGHILETLIRFGASVDVQDDPVTSVDETRGYTPLHAAAFHGNLPAVEVLLKHGANPRQRDGRYGGTPAGWASFARRQAVFERLLTAELDIFDAIDFDRADQIPAILRRDPPALHRPFGAYLPPGSQPASWSPDADVTPLAWATAESKIEAVRALDRARRRAHHRWSPRPHPRRTRRRRFCGWHAWTGGLAGRDRAHHTHAAERLLTALSGHRARQHLHRGRLRRCGRSPADPGRASRAGERAGRSAPVAAAPVSLHRAAARSSRRRRQMRPPIARLLLDCGADPNAYYQGGNASIHYTALTSVIGRGEEQAATASRGSRAGEPSA